MDRIYSVLIQNQRTTEIFRQFNPLFMETLRRKNVGVCRWFENGTTIDTAVPELCDLINDKEEWRAVVVHVEDENDMMEFGRSRYNPYDFDVNAELQPYGESKVPLIRLTHILGGIPAPEVQFRSELIKSGNAVPRVVYVPERDKEADELYAQLSEKYHFDGVAPTEIVLITVKAEIENMKRSTERAWNLARTAPEDDFWKRNAYPSSCRFISFEMAERGSVQHTCDMLKFWSAVLLISLNDIDHGSLQAYRLYNVSVDFDKAEMTREFSRVSGRLNTAHRRLEGQLETELRMRQADDGLLAPDYEMSVPVAIDTEETGDAHVSDKGYGIVSDGVGGDLNRWRGETERTDGVIRRLIKAVERSLDRASASMRGNCSYSRESVKRLSPYQTEDMYASLDKTRGRLFSLRKKLPIGETQYSKALEDADKNVQSEIGMRVTKEKLRRIMLILAIAVLLCNVPAAVMHLLTSTDMKGVIVIAASIILELALAGLAIFLVLSSQSSRLRSAIGQYNYCLKKRIAELSDGSSTFSAYLSAIASLMRGNSYMNILHETEMNDDDVIMSMRNHLREMDRFRHRLIAWGKAMHLHVDFKASSFEEVLPDYTVPARLNPLYCLGTAQDYQVPLNGSGELLCSPLCFIARIYLVQEDLR